MQSKPLEVDGVHQLAERLNGGAAAAPETVQRCAPVVPAVIAAVAGSQRHQIYDHTWHDLEKSGCLGIGCSWQF